MRQVTTAFQGPERPQDQDDFAGMSRDLRVVSDLVPRASGFPRSARYVGVESDEVVVLITASASAERHYSGHAACSTAPLDRTPTAENASVLAFWRSPECPGVRTSLRVGGSPYACHAVG